MIDTHCHIHDPDFYPEDREAVYQASRDAGVDMIVVGTSVQSSRDAVEFAATHDGVFAVIGCHPHDAKDGIDGLEELFGHEKVVGVGEIGLDFFYDNSPRDEQKDMLRKQLALAQKYDLPVSFHVRDAYDEFWPIFDEFHAQKQIRGVLHSFTDTMENAQAGIRRGLYIGINGISTFTKDAAQAEMYASLPLENIVLETDAPFLTPKPFRGKINIPAYVRQVAEFQAEARGVSVDEIIATTTQNAKEIFRI